MKKKPNKGAMRTDELQVFNKERTDDERLTRRRKDDEGATHDQSI